MRFLLVALTASLALCAGVRAPAENGAPDHLQCFKVTNQNLKRLKGFIDLDAPGVGLAPGCKLSKARLYCVPTAVDVQPETLFDGKTAIAPEPFDAPAAEGGRVCYNVSCPKPEGRAPDQGVVDAFGEHVFTKLRTQMVCAPATVSTFRITTPEVEIDPFQEISWCYYFRTPNAATAPIRRLRLELTPGVRQAIFFATEDSNGNPSERHAPGTLSASGCGLGAGAGDVWRWLHEAHAGSAELVLPEDDGSGRPLAVELPPDSAGVLLMHHVNPTDQPVTGQVTLEAEALPSGAEYTGTAAFVTYEDDVAIPPLSAGHVESTSCPLPPGASFWRVTTHTHKQSVRTEVLDGASEVFEGTDWEDPGEELRTGPPFVSFATNQLVTACTYQNPTNRTITAGDSYATDEVCMAIAHFFPADGPRLCIDGVLF